VDDKRTISTAVQALHQLCLSSQDYLVPVLGVLVELPLSMRERSNVSRIACDAIESVHESNLPTLIRTLLKSHSDDDIFAVYSTVRKHTSQVSPATLTLILEVFLECLPSSAKVKHTCIYRAATRILTSCVCAR
jgi:hypothetical protein